jgi:hypothetical protein
MDEQVVVRKARLCEALTRLPGRAVAKSSWTVMFSGSCCLSLWCSDQRFASSAHASRLRLPFTPLALRPEVAQGPEAA